MHWPRGCSIYPRREMVLDTLRHRLSKVGRIFLQQVLCLSEEETRMLTQI
jgi:hypothetical protein